MLKTILTRAITVFLFPILIIVLISGCAPQPVWSYVALGDQTPEGFSVGDDNYVEYFADYIREDLGVKLEVHNYGGYGGTYTNTGRLFDLLRADQEMRQAVAEANVITIWIGENDILPLSDRYVYEMCGGEDNQDCLREGVTEINGYIDGILDEILALNPSEETRIMIAETVIISYNYKEWIEHDCFDVMQKQVHEALHKHLITATSERGIIVVPTYQVVNGPSGDRDVEGLYRINGWDLNEEGHRLIADAHREAWE